MAKLKIWAGNKLGAAGVCSLASALVPNTSLRVLDLATNRMQVQEY